MNLRLEEQILIKDIFNVSLVADSTTTANSIFLKNFPREIQHLGSTLCTNVDNISLVDHSTYFDSLLMYRLQIPRTEVLYYLEECMGRCNDAIDKPWNNSIASQKFIQYATYIVKNFIFLSLQYPDMFSEQLEIDTEANKIEQKMMSIAMRMMSHFERRGFNPELIKIVHPKIQEEVQGDFAECFLEVLLARQRFQNILDSKAYFYQSLLVDLISIPEFKHKFMHLKNLKWIPGYLGKLQGSRLDNQSPFGLFVRMSILGTIPGYYHQENEANVRLYERMMQYFGKYKINRDKLKFYGNLQNEFYNKLTETYKMFLKKDSQKEFLQWNYALIYSNLKKAKIGSRLQNSNNSDLSHDGLVLNVYSCLLNICKVILKKYDKKYDNIDPEYFVHNYRIKLCRYYSINKRYIKESKMQVEKYFGTITEFFFLCLELVHVGVVPVQDNFLEMTDLKYRLEKYKQLAGNNQYKLKQIQFELYRVQCKMIRYYIVLLDDSLINSSIKLFDMLLFLLPKWLQFDYDNMYDGIIKGYKGNHELAHYLPEFLLESIYKYHLCNFKFKNNYLLMVGEDHLHEIVKFTCLLLSYGDIVSNPYIGANFIELLFYFLHENKSGVISYCIRTNTTAQRNLTYGLIRFYCDIAVTGSSHQFYSKFKYRYYSNKIFTSLWMHEVYRKNLKSYFHKPVFEKFLNMVMTDTTYCFDESNQNYEKYQALETKKQQGPLSPEEMKNYEQISTIINSTLNQSTSNLKLMRELSAWSPETFLSEAERTTVVPLLNTILKTFVDPTTFAANRQLLMKYKFYKEIVLSDLLQIYVNIDINEKLSNEIIKDTRVYKKEYFSKALQKASNEHYTSIEVLERFENLINKLSTAVNEYDDYEIYGYIPDRYLCALMCTLMKDPVLLPGSGNVVDRVTIYRSLLIDYRDPFTRAPLKVTELKEMKELREEIYNWKKKRLQYLKHADKDIKYGKIGANKKEGNEGDDVFGDRILDYDYEND